MDEGRMKERETLCYIKTMLVERLKELQEIKSDDENQFAERKQRMRNVWNGYRRYGRMRRKTDWISI